MKNKILVSLMIIAVLVLICSCGNTQQGDGSVTETPIPDVTNTTAPDVISDTAVVVKADECEGKIGDTVEVPVYVLNGNPLNGIQFIVKFDNTKVKLASTEESIDEQVSEALGGMSSITITPDSLSYAWINSIKKSADEKIMALKFEILSGSVGESVDITISNCVAAAYNEKDESVAYDEIQTVNGAINIK